MASIGGITTTIMRGTPPTTKPRVDTWQVPGLDGYGAQLLGEGDSEFDLTTIFYAASDAAANSKIASCENLQGQLVNVITDFGDTYPNVLVVHMDPAIKRPMIYQGSNAIRVEIHWKLLTAN